MNKLQLALLAANLVAPLCASASVTPVVTTGSAGGIHAPSGMPRVPSLGESFAGATPVPFPRTASALAEIVGEPRTVAGERSAPASPIPGATAVIAGALLLLPFGWSTLRILRK